MDSHGCVAVVTEAVSDIQEFLKIMGFCSDWVFLAFAWTQFHSS